ncbi:MAG TPA: hypothetical protein VG733_05185 [Chthoniobacteraceae bacterium]|nr:hypothetical protein [Chthoniobacteraceae bacterium]
MASVYIREKSRFYWLKFRDPATFKITRRATSIDHTLPGAARKSRALAAEYTRKEMSAPGRHHAHENFEHWAEAYLRSRCKNPHTLVNTLKGLRDAFAFFREHGVASPRQLTFEVAAGYMAWRLSGKDLPAISHNTARVRFMVIRVLMRHAKLLGYCEVNCTRDIEIPGLPPKEKQEITAEDQAIIESVLQKKRQWMREQWLVLMRQGCRVAETIVPMNRIDERAMIITLKLKGGKLHTAALHPDLLPLVKLARKENRPTLIVGPPNWSPIWCQFFQSLDMRYSIHCTRVTVITRLLREGHSPALVCAFIGHSEEVNVIYRRLKPPDSRSLLATLAGAPTPSRGNAKRQTRGKRAARPAHARA